MSPTPSPADGLPPLDADSRAQAEAVAAHIRERIDAAGGALPFDRFMELALYAPGLGYYVAGSRKFGAEGDFVTAPEISPLFGRALARQCAQVLAETGGGILEFGAGTGTMAADILLQLEADRQLPDRYCILELSPELRGRQRETLAARVPALLERVEWLDKLPSAFSGVLLGNELLDAMPVQRFRLAGEGVEEAFVVNRGDGFDWQWQPAVSPGLVEAVRTIRRAVQLPDGYESEINLRLAPWMSAVADTLQQGVMVLVDYGYSGREYYHPERHGGTLICHFRHRAHDNPLVLAGLQDITANVDFSAVARAATAAGLALAGYSTQAHFLIGCGLDALLGEADPADHLDLVQGVKQLTLPSAMGERFKAIAFSRGLDLPLCGFAMRDLSDRL
jgi:SAM-dependent MidA family methyltransferase